MGKHSGNDGDNVSMPLPETPATHHAAPEQPLVSEEQLAKDVAMFDRFEDKPEG